MLCENKFCVYWLMDECILDTIELDARGCCLECVLLDIPEQVLEKAKDKLFQSYVEDEMACE